MTNPVAAMLARHYCVAGTELSHPVRQAIAEIERLSADVNALRLAAWLVVTAAEYDEWERGMAALRAAVDAGDAPKGAK
jgi:hypothetical protein